MSRVTEIARSLRDIKSLREQKLFNLEEDLDKISDIMHKAVDEYVQELKHFVNKTIIVPDDEAASELQKAIDTSEDLSLKLQLLQNIFNGFNSKSSDIFVASAQNCGGYIESSKSQEETSHDSGKTEIQIVGFRSAPHMKLDSDTSQHKRKSPSPSLSDETDTSTASNAVDLMGYSKRLHISTMSRNSFEGQSGGISKKQKVDAVGRFDQIFNFSS